MRTVYLGMGTNLDDRDGWLDRGLALLEERLVSRRAVQAMNLSPRYETEAWGMAPGTPAFLNMVVGVDTDLPLPDLLRVGLDVERECGRVRDPEAEGYTNRTLDVDVLCTSKGETWEADEATGLDLNVPHPRMMTRRFVLQPLVDLAPELLVNGRAVAEALGACPAKPEVMLHVVEPAEKR
ncbi:MAG: 2-amino-4-hydroxy-6-hydroxymethyldihydropteridine diphosphokinase [Flavobacteriales bacterium]|nr:2-amino-4-hydroxy-6-hydroxymethyldihydropteridine diphosphokinase [Flavobacteriales bacterium]